MAKRNGQTTFQGKDFQSPDDKFGGSLLGNSNPKRSRPLESKMPIHLVLRAIKGGMRLPKNFGIVNQTVADTSRKHGVTIYKYSNNGNHLHLVIKIPSRPRWSPFIRELTGRIAQQVQELKGRQADGKFWLHRPFTRIVRSWKQAFKSACEYVELNFLEAEGFISRKETNSLRELRALWRDG